MEKISCLVRTLRLTPGRLLLRAFSAWCLLNLIVLLVLSGTNGTPFYELSYARELSLPLYLLFFGLSFLACTVLDALCAKQLATDPWILFLSVIGLAAVTAAVFENMYYVLFLLVPIAVLTGFLIRGKLLTSPRALRRRGATLFCGARGRVYTVCLLLALAGIFLFFVGTVSVLRYKAFCSSGFDFGIFVNTFHYMKETGLPLATCERDRLLSHFAVHVSPIFYLLLPIYALVPSPLTLQLAQVVLLASGVFPVYLLCRRYRLSRPLSFLTVIIYLGMPALAAGTFFDFHENCFLVPLLLWFFWAFEEKRRLPMYLLAALVLMVKEDAAVYILFFALYAFFGRERRRDAAILFAGAAAYMAGATYLLDRFGTGVMTGRYENYIYQGEGLLGMVVTCIKNPGYVFSQFAHAGEGGRVLADKLLYILQMLVPLGFVPFMTSKLPRFLLLGPFILVNLMPLYVYQYDIDFQYSFGTLAFLILLFIMNASDMRRIDRRAVVSFCSLAALLLSLVSLGGRFGGYTELWNAGEEQYAEMERILDSVDEDASVTASGFFVPHLADREEIYEVYYHKITGEGRVLTDYVIIDMRYEDGARFLDKYLRLGCYEVYEEHPGLICILIRGDLVEAASAE